MSINFISEPKYIIAVWDDNLAEYAINNEKKNELGPFKPVTTEFLKKISSIAINVEPIGGRIPICMKGFKQYVGSYKIAFTTNRMKKTIVHKKKKFEVAFPKMLWLYASDSHSLNLYCIPDKDKENISPIDFSNVSSGRVCIGSSPAPTSTSFIKIIEEINSMFFDGEFTHDEKIVKVTKEVLPKWKTISKFLNTL